MAEGRPASPLGFAKRITAGALSWAAVNHPVWVIGIAAALALAGAWLGATRLRLDADTNNLIASDRPFMERYNAFLREFGDIEYILVAVHDRAATPNPAAAKAAVDELVERLRQVPDLPAVHGWISPEEMRRVATRAMPEPELQGLSMAGGGVGALAVGAEPRSLLATANRLLAGITAITGPDRATRERDGAAAVMMLRAVAASVDGAVRQEMSSLLPGGLQREYLVSPSGRMYYIQILPVKDYGVLDAIKEPLRQIRQVIDEVRPRHPQVDIGLTGKPVLQADELETSQRDMTRATVVGFSLITLLYIFVFRGWRRPVFVAIAFVMAFGWTYGFAALAVGRLNLLSMVFMLVLVAVGLDYGVHFLARYMEYRRNSSTSDAVRRTIDMILPGNVSGAVTSAVVFLAALLTDFQGLRELGVIAGVGLLLCMTAMMTVLPAQLVLASVLRKGRPVKLPSIPESGGPSWVRFPIRRPVLFLVVIAVASLAIVFAPFRVSFQSNLLELQAEGIESVEWEHRIIEDSVAASWFGAIVADQIRDIPPIVERAKAQSMVGQILSVLDIIQMPTPEREALRHALAEGAADPPAPEPAGDTSLASLVGQAAQRLSGLANLAERQAPAEAESLRAVEADLRAVRARLEDDTTRAETEQQVANTVREIGASFASMLQGNEMELRPVLPAALRDQLMSPNGAFLVSLFPNQDIWEMEPMREFTEQLLAVDPDATGVPFTVYESAREMESAFTFMATFSAVAIAVIVWIDFFSIIATLLVMLVLGMGMYWTFACMGLFDIPLNLANFFGVPILLGISIDSGIHLVHRFREDGPDRLWPVPLRRAVVVSTLTSTVGFGGLIFAHHRGVQSLGWIMVVGSFACMLSMLLLLPAVLTLIDRRRAARLALRDGTASTTAAAGATTSASATSASPPMTSSSSSVPAPSPARPSASPLPDANPADVSAADRDTSNPEDRAS